VGHGAPKILVGWATMHLAHPIFGLHVRQPSSVNLVKQQNMRNGLLWIL